MVATSDEEIDNILEALLAREGIDCFRGAHDDVLKRFVLATSNLDDRDIVVRLTADNVFPDGEFIESLLRQFITGKADYLGASSPLDGLPYGLSGEVFTAAALRNADRETSSSFDREHVTPWIIRHSNISLLPEFKVQPSWARLRCTLDSFEDYKKLSKVFDGVADSVSIPWQVLVARLEAIAPEVGGRCPFKLLADGSIHSELTLGTVQLGVPYGVANKTGMPSDLQAKELLQSAIDSGVTTFDTARGYGESESRLGHLLSLGYRDRISIVTKLNVMSELPADASAELVGKLVDESVFHSCHDLRRNSIDTMLLHRWEHHDNWGGAVWRRLVEHKKSGLIGHLGVSVSAPHEAIEALKDPNVSHIQAPINLLDWRWKEPNFLAAVNKRSDVIWHARSVLLQGLLLLPPESWPRIPEVNSKEINMLLDGLVHEMRRVDRIDLCIAYVRSMPWVTSLVVGMDNASQLNDNLEKFHLPKLTLDQLAKIDCTLPCLPVTLLNPALWKEFL